MNEDLKILITDLAEKILYHKRLYYKGLPEISDHQFDLLEEQLKKISPNHPLLAQVGSIADESKKIAHQIPMLSPLPSFNA